jgi:HNH endonuclease
MVFRYADTPHTRRHGPQGYQDYRSYKPWLRDEFAFRCVYCLCRERWFPDGDDNFSVDHIRPRSVASEHISDYSNLVYACCQCNAAKQGATGVPDPCEEPFGRHLGVLADGTIRGLTTEGVELIKICRLDRPKLNAFRRGMLELFRELQKRRSPEAAALRRRFFGFPANLPRLSALRPPGGNVRPNGIESSYFEQQRRGELATTY